MLTFPFKLVKNVTAIFFYFFKGAIVDAALKWNGRIRSPKGSFPKAGIKPKEENGFKYYDADDLMRQWKITSQGLLILKNNSQNHAYNLQLLNADEIFSYFEKLDKMANLPPNQSIELKVEFVQNMIAETGMEADNTPDIPEGIKGKTLVMQYENEKGTKF